MYVELHAASAFSFLEAASLPLSNGRGRTAASSRKLARESTSHRSPRPPHFWRLPVLVASQEGYRNLCRLITRMKLNAPKGEGSLTLDELDGFTTGLVALAGRPALLADRHGVGGLV